MFDEVLDNFRVDRLQTVVEDVGFKTLEKSSVRDAVRPEPLVYAVEKSFIIVLIQIINFYTNF